MRGLDEAAKKEAEEREKAGEPPQEFLPDIEISSRLRDALSSLASVSDRAAPYLHARYTAVEAGGKIDVEALNEDELQELIRLIDIAETRAIQRRQGSGSEEAGGGAAEQASGDVNGANGGQPDQG
jgi:hypothetical protein